MTDTEIDIVERNRKLAFLADGWGANIGRKNTAEIAAILTENADEIERLRAIIDFIYVDLAALVADPKNPDFSLACPTPADASCVLTAYNHARPALPPKEPTP